jgi:lipopolysaccharide assembly outer membrane protein LptD (OstA)
VRHDYRAAAIRLMRSIPVVIALACPLHGPALPSAAGAVTIPKPASLSADELTVDNNGSRLVATGNVVAVYGTLRATGDLLRLDRPTGIATLAGHASVTEPRGRATADAIRLTVVGEQRVTQVDLTGHVSVADARGRAAADAVTLTVGSSQQLSRVQMTGHASVESREYALLAQQIIGDRDADLLTADGNVTMYSAPDLIVSGAHLTYDHRADHAVVTGEPDRPALVQNRYGRILGASMELFRRAGRAVVHGPVDAEVYDATLTGAQAVVDLRAQVAVVTGHVVVSRQQGTLLADRVTIFYQARRLIAEGETHMTINELEPPASP